MQSLSFFIPTAFSSLEIVRQKVHKLSTKIDSRQAALIEEYLIFGRVYLVLRWCIWHFQLTNFALAQKLFSNYLNELHKLKSL